MLKQPRFAVLLLFTLTGTSLATNGFTQGQAYMQCGALENAYGPFDYTNPEHFREKLPIVENAHFTSEVESFQGHNKCRRKGREGCEIASDISYTLHAFPNHHRALMAMARYHIEGRATKGPMRRTAECFFDRAIRFKPEDGAVRMIFGYYLSKIGKLGEAMEQYQQAVYLTPNSAEAHYNLALMYTKSADYQNARQHAYRAYELGFPLPGLRRKLERLDEWVAPEPIEPLAKE